MKKLITIAILAAATAVHAQTQLTIYNQNFATVKERRTLDLPKGESAFRVTDITAHLEPDSVILRDLNDPTALQILEQNYESDPLGEGLLLRQYEGKTLDFEVIAPQTGEKKIVKGKLLRSSYVPHSSAYQMYGQQYYQAQMLAADQQAGGQPIVEVDGKIQFELPGRPLFDALDPAAFLKPTLLWRLRADKAGKHETEFSYLTGGMRWEASYNVVAPEKSDTFDLIGWVTLENMSGKDFENASVKLMAGDVARAPRPDGMNDAAFAQNAAGAVAGVPSVTEKAFDDYHLYTLARPTAVLDREIKQVEFVRAANVPAQRLYVYDGFKSEARFQGWGYDNIRNEPTYGIISNPKVWVMLEFKNTEKAGLGLPLPQGKVKVYRRDADDRNEFIGEDSIDHTPRDETVRLYTGNAFDVVGERKQTSFKRDESANRWVDESFEITVRNHKKEDIQVRVVEHLYRWMNWEISNETMEHLKTDAKTIEFHPKVPANGQAVIHYTAHYTW